MKIDDPEINRSIEKTLEIDDLILAVTSHNQKPKKDGPWAKLKMPQKNNNKPLCDEQVTSPHNICTLSGEQVMTILKLI